MSREGAAVLAQEVSCAGGAEVAGRVVHGAVRGAIGAMAMTGMRELTRRAGLLEEPPPEAIVRQRLLPRTVRLLPGVKRSAKRGRLRAGAEILHWSYGAVAGAAFAALPSALRRRPWSGPIYGLVVWAGFELAIAPALKLEQAKRVRPLDRIALILDHLLYGFVLSELGRRPRATERDQASTSST